MWLDIVNTTMNFWIWCCVLWICDNILEETATSIYRAENSTYELHKLRSRFTYKNTVCYHMSIWGVVYDSMVCMSFISECNFFNWIEILSQNDSFNTTLNCLNVIRHVHIISLLTNIYAPYIILNHIISYCSNSFQCLLIPSS